MSAKYIYIFFVSMIPLIELRGAMLMAAGWKLPMVQSLIICVIGNMLPVPVIYFFSRKVLEWGKDKRVIGPTFTKILEKGRKAGEKVRAKAGRNGMFLALLLFVGIPLPGTGAWTGTLAASFLDMGFKKSVIAVLMGVILAGIIMGVLSSMGFAIMGY